jgi:hypothetical protein
MPICIRARAFEQALGCGLNHLTGHTLTRFSHRVMAQSGFSYQDLSDFADFLQADFGRVILCCAESSSILFCICESGLSSVNRVAVPSIVAKSVKPAWKALEPKLSLVT